MKWNPRLTQRAKLPRTEPAVSPLRQQIWRIVFQSDTAAGRWFDVVLLWLIGVSVLVVALESVEGWHDRYLRYFRVAEWVFTFVFTVEYLVRLWVVRRPGRYATSFFGLVDLVSILPSYFELIFPGSHYLMTMRVLRLMRMFRVLKMAAYMGESSVLLNALRASRPKIMVFLLSVLGLVCVEGTVMYVLEHGANPGFRNIPQSIYWAIVTITTVGYGDVAPITVLGKIMASIIMLTGFAILAVPTGVVTAELGREMLGHPRDRRRCRECGCGGHLARARYCHQCGTPLS